MGHHLCPAQPNLFLHRHDKVKRATERSTRQPFCQFDDQDATDSVVERLPGEPVRISQPPHWCLVGDRVSDLDPERPDIVGIVESKIDVQVTHRWDGQPFRGRGQVTRAAADDPAMTADPDGPADEEAFDHATEPLEPDHPIGLDRLDRGTDLIRVGGDHQRRRTLRPGSGTDDVAKRIDIDAAHRRSKVCYQPLHDRMFMPRDAIDSGVVAQPLDQPLMSVFARLCHPDLRVNIAGLGD